MFSVSYQHLATRWRDCHNRIYRVVHWDSIVLLCFFRSLLLHLVLIHLTELLVGDGEVLHLALLALHLILVLVRSRRHGAPGYADLVALIQRRGEWTAVVLVRDVVLLPAPLLPAGGEHDGGVEDAGRAGGAGLQPEGSLVQGGARSDGGALYGAEIQHCEMLQSDRANIIKLYEEC